MFKRTLALALFLSTAAHGADILESSIVENAPSDWSGLQLSVFGGAFHSTGEARLGEFAGGLIQLDVSNGLFPRSIDDDEYDFSGGIGIGYDHQFGNWIGGLAIDGSFASLDIEHRFSRVDPNPAAPFTGVITNTSYQTEIDWFATARVRLGYAFNDDLMFYGTGGFAMGDVTNHFAINIPELPVGSGVPFNLPGETHSGTETGFVIGVGLEKKLTENLRLTFSLEYVDLGDVNVRAVDPVNFPGQELNYRFENEFATAKVGLTFSF